MITETIYEDANLTQRSCKCNEKCNGNFFKVWAIIYVSELIPIIPNIQPRIPIIHFFNLFKMKNADYSEYSRPRIAIIYLLCRLFQNAFDGHASRNNRLIISYVY